MSATQRGSLTIFLDEIDDAREPSNGTLYNFRGILVILIAAVLSDCDTVEDITFWARTKEAWLRRFLVFENGIPSEETFLRILRALDPKQFENMFRRWVGGVVTALSGDAGLGGTVAIDGKTVRGSGTGGESAIHMVSTFATELAPVLGQEKVAAKCNEITAIPELFEALSIKGDVDRADRPKCVTIGRIDSIPVVGDKASELAWRHHISSRALTAEQLATEVRAHWGVENRLLHGVLDGTTSEDASTVAKDNAPRDLSLMRKIALNIIRADKTNTRKSSLRRKRKGAAWDDGVREHMLEIGSIC